jgi:predicted nucleic acid-binding Zn ribbon protein
MTKNNTKKNSLTRTQRRTRTYQIIFSIISLLVLASMLLTLIR